MSRFDCYHAIALCCAVLLAGCTAAHQSPRDQAHGAAYAATIHRTEGGFPHIVAQDFGSLGFGTGYAAAQDNVCLMAKNVLRLRGKLSQYLGPDNGNLNSDIFRAYMAQTGMYDAPVSPELEYVYTGFAQGFNHYLRETGINNIPDATCRGAPWIPAMTADDVRRAELTPAFLPHLADLFLAAAPPGAAPPGAAPSGAAPSGADPEQNTHAGLGRAEQATAVEIASLANRMASAHDKGSNGVAIGSDLTRHAGGILYTNPHLDWDVSFHFFPRHQIIPGVTNLLGANTYERPLVGFGTNGKVAWTNTVSTSRTLALYQLKLVPGNPMAYLFDGSEETIRQIEINTGVLETDGVVRPHRHTLYASRHGLLLGMAFPWDAEKAFALRIADEGNRGQNGLSRALARANDVHDIKKALSRYQATANTNTIATDRDGNAFYGDMGPVANMSDAQLRDCALPTPVRVPRFAPAFRGDSSACEWQTDADSAAPGLLGASKQASLVRRDYVTNSNDSYWLANPAEPIADIPAVQGNKESERTLRTRTGLAMIGQRMAGTDGLRGNTFDIDSIVDRMLSNQNHAGQLLRDDLVTLCRRQALVNLEGKEVDLSEACEVLADWDLHSNLDSRGAHLFREFMRAASGGELQRHLPPTLNYAVPFSETDPVNTPRGLDTRHNPQALQALAKAVVLLNDAAIPLDSQLGDLQSVRKNEERIPLHGGEEGEGVFNKMAFAFTPGEGYTSINGSSASWVMAVEFADQALLARGVLAYSISGNPQSAHYADMTRMFSRKELVDLPYELEDVEAAALHTIEVRLGAADCGNEGWRNFPALKVSGEQDCRAAYRAIRASQLRNWLGD